MKSRIPWGRILAEGAIIVMSILLAFAIDRWWEERALQGERRVLVGALAEDFEVYLSVIELRREQNESQVAAARRLLREAGPSAEAEDAAEFGGDLTELWGYFPLEFGSGAVDEILRGEDAEVLGRALRNELRAWVWRLELLERQNAYLAEVSMQLYLFLLDRFPTRNFNPGIAGESSFPIYAEPLLRDVEFESLVWNRGNGSDLIVSASEALEANARRILDLIYEDPSTP